MKAAREWLRSCFLSGQKLQMVHHGADLASFASMRLQLEGTRLLITARLSEVAAICQQELNAEGNLERADGPYQANVQDCVNWLIRLDEVPPATQIPSLCSALMKPGDVTYLPPGYLVVDKACHETNISLNLTRFQYGCVCATACRCSSVMRWPFFAHLRRFPLAILPPTLRPGFTMYAEFQPKPHSSVFVKLCKAFPEQDEARCAYDSAAVCDV